MYNNMYNNGERERERKRKKTMIYNLVIILLFN